MILLNNMYTGRYITEQGKLGHESINLIKADDGNFYIWLNSMGVCTEKGGTVLMVRSINSTLYKVLAKAENCRLCPGANISRKVHNSGKEDKENREKLQRAMGVTYNKKDPMNDIFGEQDMFATFVTKEVYEAKGDIYITNEVRDTYPENCYYAQFRISEAMRAYVREEHAGYGALKALLEADVWENVREQESCGVQRPEMNFFKLIRKDKDELSFSNAMAYFINKVGIPAFLEACLMLESSFLEDSYELERERNNIDISFFGKKHVVIIENKIDAFITEAGNKTVEDQIKKAAKLYSKEAGIKEEAMETQLRDVLAAYTGAASQLSKYYLYAAAWLLGKGVPVEQVGDHIRCFLLIPEYARKQFPEKEGFYDSCYLLSERYRLLSYRDIYGFFKDKGNTDRYMPDFLSALKPLRNEFNNDLEQDMKYRFYQAIGKVK